MKFVKDPARFLADNGLLFEINRQLLHPHGLALSITYPDTPEEFEASAKSETVEVRLWDCREDPEGIYFAPDTFKEGLAKLDAFEVADEARLLTRNEKLGYVVQTEAGPPEEASMTPWEACAGYHAGTEILGVVWADERFEAERLATLRWPDEKEAPGEGASPSSVVFVREPIQSRRDKYIQMRQEEITKLQAAEVKP